MRATTLNLSGFGPPTKMSDSGMPASRNRCAIACAPIVTLPVCTEIGLSVNARDDVELVGLRSADKNVGLRNAGFTKPLRHRLRADRDAAGLHRDRAFRECARRR